MKSIKKLLYLFITGLVMGSADVVPGVSGGTVALVMGIYKELIHSIKTMSGRVLSLILKLNFRQAVKEFPFTFITPLGVGILTAVFLLAGLIKYLLHEYPVYLWAVFFGFILASALVVKKRVGKWDNKNIAALIVSAIAAYFIVGIVPVNTPETLFILFISGAIAICATILPGVSGSFLLVIMGKYEQVLTAIADRDVVSLAVFFAGAAMGMALFARLLSWLFIRYHDVVMAALTGLMLGSLRKIWPWQEVVATRVNSEGAEVPLVTRNVFPATLDVSVGLVLLLVVAAVFLVLYVEKKGRLKANNDIGLV